MRRITAITILTGACGLALAGPIDPPSGPVQGTMKSLAQVEPRIPIGAETTPGDSFSVYRIAAPGSYYLTGDLSAPAGKSGIRIDAPGVTIDLNGFRIVGQPGSGAGIGFQNQSGQYPGVVVRNGTVMNCGSGGVELYATGTIGAIVENVVASGNGNIGIMVPDGGIIRHCTAVSNGSFGMQGGVSRNSIILDSVATLNDGSGFLLAGAGGVIRGCSAALNTGDGIVAGNGCTVEACSVRANGASGIFAANGITVRGCTASFNTRDGIRVETDCNVIGNTCDGNGASGDGAGVHVLQSGNRVEANICTDADRGVDVDGSDNVILRNTCSGNTTNWHIASGNAVARIVAATTNAIEIIGDAYAGDVGSTDPNVNITY
jgi:parallel beta-helix repeat protein